MRKIQLNVEELAVESFPTTADARAERGTVRGRESDETYTYPEDPTDPPDPIDPSYSADINCHCVPAYTVGADGCSRVEC